MLMREVMFTRITYAQRQYILKKNTAGATGLLITMAVTTSLRVLFSRNVHLILAKTDNKHFSN